MKILGILILLAAIALGIYSLNMDISVPVYNSFTGDVNRVVNISLINQQQNYMFIAGFGLIVGLILYIMGKKNQNIQSLEKSKEESSNYDVVPTEKGFNYTLYLKNEAINFENIKKQALEFYKKEGFDQIKIDEPNSFLVKNKTLDAYIEVKDREDLIKLSIFNSIKADFVESLYPINEVEELATDATDKLIELSKMLEKGLISQEEFINFKKAL